MERMLYHGDSPEVATGFGNVSRNLLKGLSKNWDITVIGINSRGGYKDPKDYPYKIYPAIYNDFNDIFGFKRLLNTLLKQDPEIKKEDYNCLFMQYDFTLIAESYVGEVNLFMALKDIVKKPVKKVLYTPIDNPLIKPQWKETLAWFDVLLVPSYYARAILENTFGTKWVNEKVRVVYYGVEDLFKPLSKEEKIKIRQEMANALKVQDKIEVDLTNKYIVGFVGRNQWRKDIYRTIKIFSEFRKNNSKAYLYLHTNPYDLNHDGGNLLDLLDNFGMKFGLDYLIPVGLNTNTGIVRSDMNEVYNLMDVYLSSSVAEGFGLPIIEAMKAGVPVLVPNNTTMPELVGNTRGIEYKINNTVCFGQIDFMRERELGDVESATEWLRVLQVREMAGQNRNQIKNAKEFADKITVDKMVKEVQAFLT